MKKLLYLSLTSIFILMSFPAFATDDQIELSLYRVGISKPVTDILTNKSMNEDQKELALYRQGHSQDQVKIFTESYKQILDSFTSAVDTTSTSTSTTSSVVPMINLTNENNIVQKASRSLISLKDPNSPLYNEFRQTFFAYLRRAPCEKKEYAFPHFIHKFLEERLYDINVYSQWRRTENSFKTKEKEKIMASTEVQRNAYYAYMYKVMSDTYNTEIKEFKSIGSSDTRLLESIVQSTFNPDVRLNTAQNITNDVQSLFKKF